MTVRDFFYFARFFAKNRLPLFRSALLVEGGGERLDDRDIGQKSLGQAVALLQMSGAVVGDPHFALRILVRL